jgi:tetratricopeptide (TPR) repeat protein
LSREPNREPAVSKAASLAMRMNRNDDAERLWRHALELNPWIEDYHANLAQILAGRGDWAGARNHADGWLKLDPGSVAARALLVEALLETGEKGRARAEFGRIEALKPKNLDELRMKFGARLR